MSNRALEYPVLVLIGFLAFFIGTWFFTGFYGSDDLSYLGAIRGIAEHGGYSPKFGGARLGLVYPGALIYKMTGGNLFATIYHTTFYFVGTTILAYFVGRVLHDGVTGLLAAVLVATCPVFYLYSGALFPDAPLAFWMAAWFLALAHAFSDKNRFLENEKFACLILIAAGAFNGFAYMSKMNGLIVAVPAFFAIILYGGHFQVMRTFRRLAYYAIGLLAVLAMETAMFWSLAPAGTMTGPGIINRLGFLTGQKTHLVELGVRDGVTPLSRLATAHDLLFPMLEYGLYLALIALAVYPLMRCRSWFFWGATAWVLIYQTLGSTSLLTYLPPAIVDRYFAILVMPMAVLTAASIVWLAQLPSAAIARLSGGHGPSAIIRATRIIGIAALSSVALWGAATIVSADISLAGKISWGGDVARAVINAQRQARRDYPEYPILFSDFLSARMAPMLLAHRVSNMYLTTEKIQPNPPFILIRAVALDPRDKTVNRLEKKFSDRNIRRRTLAIVYPPKDRVRDIADRFSDYLMDGTIGGTSNQFVSVARGIAIDLFATGRGASQNHRDGVTLFDLQAMPSKFYSFHRSAEVARRITGENVIRLLPALGKARALLRMFDRSSETYPPYGKLGHFPPQGGRFRVTVTLESPQKNALIEPRLYAYAGKTVVASLKLNEMNLSAGAVTMRGEITVDRPIDSFRVDLWSRVKIPGDFSAYVIRDVRFEALAPN